MNGDVTGQLTKHWYGCRLLEKRGRREDGAQMHKVFEAMPAPIVAVVAQKRQKWSRLIIIVTGWDQFHPCFRNIISIYQEFRVA